MKRHARLLVPVVCALLVGGGGQGHTGQTFRARPAETLPPFGSAQDEEHAQAMAEAVIEARSKRNHPHDRFRAVTEAYTNTRTLYSDIAQGRLIGPRGPYSEDFNHEVKLVLELGPHHKLRVASYEERAIQVPPPREQP